MAKFLSQILDDTMNYKNPRNLFPTKDNRKRKLTKRDYLPFSRMEVGTPNCRTLFP